jgi:hypothetical protein
MSGGTYAFVLLFYVVQYFVIFFCNTALVGAAMIRLRGGDPTVGDGFRIAVSRIQPILGYALIAATVGMVLRAISERSGLLGRLVIASVGLAWNLATYLVVPVLVVEDVGPIEAVSAARPACARPGAADRRNIGIMVFGLISPARGGRGRPAGGRSATSAALIISSGCVVLAFVAIALVSSA